MCRTVRGKWPATSYLPGRGTTFVRRYLVREGGPRVARHVLQEIGAAFRLLVSHPEAGHLRRDLTSLPVKFWQVFSYLIVYDAAASPLAIVRVLHGKRDVRTILDRRPGS